MAEPPNRANSMCHNCPQCGLKEKIVVEIAEESKLSSDGASVGLEVSVIGAAVGTEESTTIVEGMDVVCVASIAFSNASRYAENIGILTDDSIPHDVVATKKEPSVSKL